MRRMAADLPDDMRCSWIKTTGTRCKQPRTEDDTSSLLCVFHVRMQEEAVKRRVLARDMADIDPLDALRELMKMAAVMCRRLELDLLDSDIPDLMSVMVSETRVGGAGGSYDLTRLDDTQRAIVLAYRAERAELRSLTQLAIAQGLAEREQKLHEAEIGILLQVMISFAQAAGLDADSREVRQLMATALRTASGQKDLIGLGG